MAYSSSSLGNKKLKKGSGSSDHPQAPPRRANATTTTCYPSSSSPPPADEETVSVLRSYVDGTGPTVVFVHGWPDDHTMWDEQVSWRFPSALCLCAVYASIIRIYIRYRVIYYMHTRYRLSTVHTYIYIIIYYNNII